MKKNKIVIRLLFFFVLLFFNYAYSQNKIFKYDFEYKPNPLKDSTILEKTVLDINSSHLSVFRTEQDRKTDSLKALNLFGFGRKMRFENQFYIIKKLSDNIIQKSIETLFSEMFVINIDEKLNWEILSEKSKIATFDVQKAKVTYGGRNWTAWFTTEIPIQDGPYIFKGLPGLIVKISDDKNDYNFNLTEIKNGDNKIYYRNKASELTWEQFKKLSENYYSDPFERIKSIGMPMKKDDGAGNAVSVNIKYESDKMKRIIRENNNPIELNHKVDYK